MQSNSYTHISTNITQQERNKLQSRIDAFSTFMWRGINAWTEFGVFIIAENRGDLKFYNGPQFSNTYSSPQFQSSSGNLMGVTFKQQTIQFKIGMYWFDIETYRRFLAWLDPYEINYLSLGIDTNYGYLVKLANYSDSPRYIVGKENGEPRYYTEFSLNWEVQGQSCLRSINPWNWQVQQDSNEFNFTTNNTSELKTPIIFKPIINLNESVSNNLKLKLEAHYIKEDEEEISPVTLFNIEFQNLTFGTEFMSEETNINNELISPVLETNYVLHLNYDSENGLVFIEAGNIKKIINLLTATTEGVNLIKTIDVKKFYMPGTLNTDYNIENFYLKFIIEGDDQVTYDIENSTIITYSRISAI